VNPLQEAEGSEGIPSHSQPSAGHDDHMEVSGLKHYRGCLKGEGHFGGAQRGRVCACVCVRVGDRVIV